MVGKLKAVERAAPAGEIIRANQVGIVHAAPVEHLRVHIAQMEGYLAAAVVLKGDAQIPGLPPQLAAARVGGGRRHVRRAAGLGRVQIQRPHRAEAGGQAFKLCLHQADLGVIGIQLPIPVKIGGKAVLSVTSLLHAIQIEDWEDAKQRGF